MIKDPISKIMDVAEDDDNQCWLYHAPCSDLYRASWEAHNAMPIPPGMLVRHICDQARCVNPFHLTVGTHEQNCLDRRNRTTTKRRSKNLTLSDKYDIIISKEEPSVLAQTYEISERLVNIIRDRWMNFTELQRSLFLRKVKGS